MVPVSRLLRLPAVCLASALLATSASAQRAKVGGTWYTDAQNGFRFRSLSGWNAIPVEPTEAEQGIVARLTGPPLSVRRGNRATTVYPRLHVWRLDVAMLEVESLLNVRRHPSRVKPQERAEKRYRRIEVVHETFAGGGEGYPVVLDTFTYRLPDYELAFIYEVPEEDYRKFRKAIAESARTLERIERMENADILGDDYESVLARARDEAARTPGWRVLETESQRFVVKTSSDDDRFLDRLIERLERSRDLFEADYPAPAPIEHISVVRVCATEEEFHQYGRTGQGTGGWFNPRTTELVVYDNKHRDRRETLCVISHEAFHQYCFFIFERSEAHRWFDEGQGDYYGGMDFRGRRAVPRAQLPGGYNRLPLVKEVLREERAVPIEDFVRLPKHVFYRQDAVYKYAQGWSIVYMLRRGMEGEVPKKLWKPEYAEILPRYMETLHSGFRAAYEDERAELAAEAADSGSEAPEAGELSYWDLPETRKQAIWDAAIEASWGGIDLAEFEERWKEYVLQHLK